jgi:hypothetical protein
MKNVMKNQLSIVKNLDQLLSIEGMLLTLLDLSKIIHVQINRVILPRC